MLRQVTCNIGVLAVLFFYLVVRVSLPSKGFGTNRYLRNTLTQGIRRFRLQAEVERSENAFDLWAAARF